MKKFLIAGFLFLFSSFAFAYSDTTIDGKSFSEEEIEAFYGMSAPGVSASTTARLYFDSTALQLMLSLNGAAYHPILDRASADTLYSNGGTLTISEEDLDPTGVFTGLKFPNSTLTDNLDGTVSYSPTAIQGDVQSVGDCASGLCFEGTQGTSLTFYNAGGNAVLNYDGSNFGFTKPLNVANGVTGVSLIGGGLTVNDDSGGTANDDFIAETNLSTTGFQVDASAEEILLNVKGIANAGLDVKQGATGAGFIDIYEDSDDGTNKTRIQTIAQTADITYTLPSAVGAAGTALTDATGNGVLSWAAGGGAGDVTAVGDCATGACFDGTSGTTLTFNNDGGDKTLSYGGTVFAFNAPLSVDASDPADAGAIRLDNAENIAWEASPAGTDVTLGVDASEVLQASGAFTAAGLITASNGLTSTAGTTTLATLAGTIDAGGATSLEIPNGANPTVSVAGQISVDTSATADSMFRFYGDASYQLPGYYSKSFVITGVTASSDAAVWRTPWAITIRAIHGVQVGGTNVIGQLTECDANGLNPVVVDSADITILTTNVNDDGTLSNPTIDAGDYVGWATTSVSGTITRATITFDYTIDAVN